jgi:parallel beta-helix repeat protein
MKRLKTTFCIKALALLTVAAFLITAAHASAATIRVKAGDTTPDAGGCGSKANPCDTIQAGLDNASPGDIVKISKGIYMENDINVNTNDLTIAGNKKASKQPYISGQLMCEDPTRTWAESSCRSFDNNQAACDAAWQSYSGSDTAVSCWYDIGSDDCRGCGPYNVNAGNCTNTCDSDPFCADPALSLISGQGQCRNYDGTNQVTCESYWHVGGDGPTSCFWDSTTARCVGCGDRNQALLGCTNTCGETGNVLNISSDNVLVKNLKILHAEDRAIKVLPTASDAKFEGVTVKNANDVCIESIGSNTEVLDSTLRGCGRHCIRSYVGNLAVRGSSISQCGGNGVSNLGPNLTVNGNEFDTIRYAGVYTEGVGAKIKNNAFHSVSYEAIGLQGRDFSIVNNNVKGVGAGIIAECVEDPACLDPTLTFIPGSGPNEEGCRMFDGTDKDTCESYWHMGGRGPTSCWWDGDDCRGCGTQYAPYGTCTNSCVQNTCDDGSRTFVGYGDSCRYYDNTNQATCESYWNIGAQGAASCWWDPSNNDCRGCGPQNELPGLCTNACVSSVESICEGNVDDNKVRDAVGFSERNGNRGEWQQGGFWISSVGPGVTVEGNTGTFCNDLGMAIFGRKIVAKQNTMSFNGASQYGAGFLVLGLEHTLRGNTAEGNHGDGFGILPGSGGFYKNNKSVKNFNDGFDVNSGSSDNALIGNTANKNFRTGFDVSESASNNVLEENSGKNNLLADLCDQGTGTVTNNNTFGTTSVDCGPDNWYDD